MSNFNQIIDKLNEDYAATLQKDDGDGYSRLSTIFEELGKHLREYIQEQTQADMKKIIDKLKQAKEPLTAEEKEQVRLWIVGDADYYTKLENNVQDWKDELKRLVGEITKLRTEKPDVATASRLRGLFRDGSRVLADLFYYAQQKERIARFDESTKEIDAEERQILINLLKLKIKSQDF